MTPATGGLIPAGTAIRLGDGHGGWIPAGRLELPAELHFTEAGDDDQLAADFARALTEPVTLTVPLTCLPSPLLGLLYGLAVESETDDAALAVWESEGGAAA